MSRHILTAIKKGRNDIVKVETVLLAAIRLKDVHLVRRLLAAGAPVNETGFLGDYLRYQTGSALPAAVNLRDYALVREVLNAGANVNAPETLQGKTSLYIAVENRDIAMVEFLMDTGADVNTSLAAISGNTALEVACRNNDLNMVQSFLVLGADPDEGSLVTAISGSVELVQTLLTARLNRYKRHSKGFGRRALQYTVEMENAAMIEILVANGIDVNSIIRYTDGVIGYGGIARVESALGSAING